MTSFNQSCLRPKVKVKRVPSIIKVPGYLVKSMCPTLPQFKFQLVLGTGTDELGPTFDVPEYPRTSHVGLLDLGLTLTGEILKVLFCCLIMPPLYAQSVKQGMTFYVTCFIVRILSITEGI